MRGGKDKKYQDMSRRLAWLLRHGAVTEGLHITAAGYVTVEEVLEWMNGKGPRLTLPMLHEIVQNNDKKRYQMDKIDGVLCIRATQGHSIKEIHTEQLLTKIVDPTLYPVVVHGTFLKFWPLIQADGLKRMGRNHIHFAPGMPKEEGVISGMRGTCDVIIQIDMIGAMKDGVEFYISSNNVILTQGIDGVLSPKYFLRVTSKKGEPLMLGGMYGEH